MATLRKVEVVFESAERLVVMDFMVLGGLVFLGTTESAAESFTRRG